MPLPEHWARPEDFATLFQYFWHRDFPIDERSPGAMRTDWTIHIGVIVRNIADLVGLVARFERGGRKDAVLRSAHGDEIAIEWEWEGLDENELKKLRTHRVWSKVKGDKKSLKYAVLITYATVNEADQVFNRINNSWADAPWPLLLILILSQKSAQLASGREFKAIQVGLFNLNKYTILRKAPAVPWQVESSRWYSKQL